MVQYALQYRHSFTYIGKILTYEKDLAYGHDYAGEQRVNKAAL